MKKLTFLIFFVAGVVVGVALIKNKSQAPSTQNPNSSNSSQTIQSGKTIVDRSNQGLTEFPKDVLSKTGTTELYIQNNKLTGAMPAEIRKLSSLQILDASNNMMTGVPAEVGQLTKLKMLNLANNQLTGLPNELGKLTQLETLDLRGNNVSMQDLNVIKQTLTKTTILL
ncbi:hypothetical protein EB118_01355 [bacterium]|nr:hypothetical protein [bacterium]NBX97892.1 hypothetical protein [bacterium]NDC93868.1 hypothetical protein [bacterium]NDD82815.1 hypothetical protein [bacterium]NDG28736.1 hypothetical protein [bacterium]